jgi:hypothetical protein
MLTDGRRCERGEFRRAVANSRLQQTNAPHPSSSDLNPSWCVRSCVLVFAMHEVSALKDEAVEPTHTLLGVACLGDDIAARVLSERSITTDPVRAVVAELRGRPVEEIAVVSIETTI